MWRRLFSGPWPDQTDSLPLVVRQQAAQRIHRYWRSQMWWVVLGEIVVVLAAQTQDVQHLRAYGVPVVLLTFVYILGLFSHIDLIWLVTMVIVFVVQGILIRGLGAVTAMSMMLPYTFAAMMFQGRRRIFVQACCVVGFWLNLSYEVVPTSQLQPPRTLLASYNILMAALTFQALRYTNRLAIDLNTVHVAQEVTERSQQFLARVSHELRTPLNSILGFAKLLRRAELPPTQAGYLSHIVEEGEQLNSLVSDLLDSAQLSAGKLTLNLDTCDVNDICQAVADQIQAILKPGLTLKVALGPDLPLIRADQMRLRQVVINLVGNAAKYTPQGEITIKTSQQNSHVLIAVSDTGPGIPAEDQSLVFVPFVKRDKRSAGVGLGLDIARQLARLHGGDIKLESVVGQGSTFTVELPTSK